MNLIAGHHKRVKQIVESTTHPDKGSLSWPGDKEFLAAYNVAPSDLLKAIADKITESGIPDKITEAKAIGNPDALIKAKLDDHYEITVYVKFETSEELPTCTYCKVDLLKEDYFTIRNLKKNIEFSAPTSFLHRLQHDDLGDEVDSNIDPTIACNTLELGNTNLKRNHPLYSIAQYTKDFYIKASG